MTDFAVLILTHGRADCLRTVKTLRRGGYTGRYYLVLDDEDETIDRYRQIYGNDKIITFNKQKAIDETDSMDNFDNHKAIVYARNYSWTVARNLGLRYFLQLDDDYVDIQYRWIRDGKLKGKTVKNLDKLFDSMVEFLIASDADTVALAQGGDFIGGADGKRFGEGLIRKAMNSFFCRTDRPIDFKGTMNEDVVTYTTLSSQGHLLFTFTKANIVPLQTQSLHGGMTEAYLNGGTYLKSFYAVMSMPSAVVVAPLNSRHPRIHHKVSWNCCAPKILNEAYRKGG
nr:MAG TPA: hypothetical protein [Caudoviricetes sp.]